MGRYKKIVEEDLEDKVIEEFIEKTEKSEKEKLLELYQTLKNLDIRSISDLENLIARAE